jgi:hypothetical protein
MAAGRSLVSKASLQNSFDGSLSHFEDLGEFTGLQGSLQDVGSVICEKADLGRSGTLCRKFGPPEEGSHVAIGEAKSSKPRKDADDRQPGRLVRIVGLLISHLIGNGTSSRTEMM